MLSIWEGLNSSDNPAWNFSTVVAVLSAHYRKLGDDCISGRGLHIFFSSCRVFKRIMCMYCRDLVSMFFSVLPTHSFFRNNRNNNCCCWLVSWLVGITIDHLQNR